MDAGRPRFLDGRWLRRGERGRGRRSGRTEPGAEQDRIVRLQFATSAKRVCDREE